MNMINITSAGIFFLAAGIFTSVTILSGYQILFGISLIYYTYSIIVSGEFKLPKSAYWLLAFVAVATISLILNYELLPKPSKNFGKLKYFIFGVGGVFILRIWLKEASDKTRKILCNVFLLSIILAGGAAVYSFLTIDKSLFRVKAFTNTMRYGYGTGMIMVVILSALLHRKRTSSWFDFRLGLLAFIMGFVGIYLTSTRGALLGLLCGIPFALYFYRKDIGILFSLISLIIIGTLGSIYFFGNAQLAEGSRFTMSMDNKSDVMRRSQWKSAIIAIQERPALGWGLSNFYTQVKRIKIENDLDEKDYNDSHAHNLFLEIGAGTGLVGLFFFLGWLISWAVESFKATDLTRALIVPFGVAFVVASQFEVTFDANNASMIFFLYAISMGTKNVESL